MPEDVSLAASDLALVTLKAETRSHRTWWPAPRCRIRIAPAPAASPRARACQMIGVVVSSQKSAVTSTAQADCQSREVVLTDCSDQSSVGLRIGARSGGERPHRRAEGKSLSGGLGGRHAGRGSSCRR